MNRIDHGLVYSAKAARERAKAAVAVRDRLFALLERITAAADAGDESIMEPKALLDDHDVCAQLASRGFAIRQGGPGYLDRVVISW